MNIDVSEVLAALGGGASAVMVLGMAGALILLWRQCWALWRQCNDVQNARTADQKAHADQLLESVRTLDKAIDFVEGRRG